jgi:hypothetical protein
MARSFKPETVAGGLALIALGVVWMLGNLGALDLLAALRTWWPASLVVWGLLELYASYMDRGARRS